MTIIHNPPNKPGHVVDQCWMVISNDGQGEGVVAADLGNGVMHPLMVSQRHLVPLLVIQADRLARETGMTFTLIKLSHRDVIGAIDGNGLKL